MYDYEVQAQYNALVTRGTRSAPTYAEVQRESRRIFQSRIDALIGYRG